MRLLLFSDLHVDSRTPSIIGDDIETINRERHAAFTRICALATQLHVDAVCCAGNLYDDASATESTGEALRAGFASVPVTVFLAPGSSDPWHASSLYARVGWSDNVSIFTMPALSPRALPAGITLWGAAHTQPVHDEGFLDGFQTNATGVHLALFHGCEREDFREEQMEGLADTPITAPFDAGQIAVAGLTHALLGHLRAARAQSRYTYPGRPAPAREVQRHHGGAVLLTVGPDGSVDREWYPVSQEQPSMPDTVPRVPDAQRWPAHAGQAPPAATDGWSWTAPGQPSLAHVDGGPGAFAPAPLPAWAEEVLHAAGPVDTSGIDEGTVMARFVQDVMTFLSGEEQQRVLRAGLLAMRGRLDDGGA